MDNKHIPFDELYQRILDSPRLTDEKAIKIVSEESIQKFSSAISQEEYTAAFNRVLDMARRYKMIDKWDRV